MLIPSAQTFLQGLGERALLISTLAPSTASVSIWTRRTTQPLLNAAIATLSIEVGLRCNRGCLDNGVVHELHITLQVDVPTGRGKLIVDKAVVLVVVKRSWRLIGSPLAGFRDLETRPNQSYEKKENKNTYASASYDSLGHPSKCRREPLGHRIVNI